MGQVMSSFEETLGGIRIIKAFNASKFFYDRYSKQDQDYTRNNISVQRRYDLSSPISETIGITVSAVLLWLGGRMVFRNELDPEFFLTYFAIFSQLIPPFKAFSNALYAAQKGMASLERIQELVTAPVTVEDPISPVKPKFESELALNGVGFEYNSGISVINHFNLTIKKGQTIAFVGPSGAGKTTVTDLISRFYDVTHGSITLDGQDIRNFNQDDYRRLIGIVSRGGSLLAKWFTILSNDFLIAFLLSILRNLTSLNLNSFTSASKNSFVIALNSIGFPQYFSSMSGL
jgi:ABC-type multidrug transport system fused ATPase/permease subunit